MRISVHPGFYARYELVYAPTSSAEFETKQTSMIGRYVLQCGLKNVEYLRTSSWKKRAYMQKPQNVPHDELVFRGFFVAAEAARLAPELRSAIPVSDIPSCVRRLLPSVAWRAYIPSIMQNGEDLIEEFFCEAFERGLTLYTETFSFTQYATFILFRATNGEKKVHRQEERRAPRRCGIHRRWRRERSRSNSPTSDLPGSPRSAQRVGGETEILLPGSVGKRAIGVRYGADARNHAQCRPVAPASRAA